MSKFCGHCGSTLADNATFCPSCGAPVTDQAAPQPQFNQPLYQQGMPAMGAAAPKAGMSKGAKIGIFCAIGAVALGLIIWLIIVLVGGGYKKPIKDYIKGLENQDVETFTDALTPGDSGVGSLMGGLTASTAQSTYKSKLRRMISTYGEDFSIDYDIIEKEEIPSSQTLGLIDDGYKLKVEFTITGSKTEKTVTKNITVIKSGGKWYLSSAFNLW